MGKHRIIYGNCPNGCMVKVTEDNGETFKEKPSPLKKKGKKVFCRKCGYSIGRSSLIIAQHLKITRLSEEKNKEVI